MKNTKKTIGVVPRGTRHAANGEAAAAGAAVRTVNLREREQSLQVVGQPATVGAIGAGHTLVLVHEGHYFYLDDDRLYVDVGTLLLTLAGEWVDIKTVGSWIVVVTTTALRVLVARGDTYVEMDASQALPSITVTEQTLPPLSATVPPFTFAEPYRQWQAPLADADVRSLTTLLRGVAGGLSTDAADAASLAAPVLVRWGVRLWDDSYLWMSAPRRLGDATLANADRITAPVVIDGDRFAGTLAATMPLARYKPKVTVEGGVPADWRPWVKAIDVFATAPAPLFAASRVLEYRCLTRTVGDRTYELEMGLRRTDAASIEHSLNTSDWHLVATATDVANLRPDAFVPPEQPVTITNARCAALAQSRMLPLPTCVATAGGRLYSADATGLVSQSLPGNPWVTARRSAIVGVRPLALAAVSRPLYSGGFGRYPVYVFTTDGIYALPQSAQGTMGEARLVARAVIAAGTQPVEAHRDVYFTTRQGHLCRLRASEVSVAVGHARVVQMAWNEDQAELWMLDETGTTHVLQPEAGSTYERTLLLNQLYSDARAAVAVDRGGRILDLEHEQPATQPVTYRSHPVLLDRHGPCRPYGVVWNIVGDDVHLTVGVQGGRGIWRHDFALSRHTLDGEQHLPLPLPLTSEPLRTVLLGVEGEAVAGTLLLPVQLVVTCEP